MHVQEDVLASTGARVRWLTLAQRLAVAGLLWSLAVLAFGTLIVTFDVGASCAGWPLCNDSASPPDTQAGLLTFVHRLGGLGLMLVIGGLALVAYLRLRTLTWLVRLTAALFVLVLAEAVLGGFGVAVDFPSWTSALHLTLALLLVGGLLAIVIFSRADAGPLAALPHDMLLLALGATTAILVAGAVHTPLDDGQACEPLGACIADVSFGAPAGVVGFVTPLLATALVATLVVVARVFRAAGADRTTHVLAALALASLSIGLLSPLLTPVVGEDGARALIPLWLTAAWLMLLALALPLARNRTLAVLGMTPLQLDGARATRTARDYFRVTKPGIMLLLLTTTLGGMLVAAQGWPGATLVALTLLGGALASGGASALNCYFDRDVDQLMARTRKRPIPTGDLSAVQVRGFALILSVLAVALLAAWVNPLAAMLAVGGHLFYITVYTLWLKRRTPQNIVIGGAAGSFPPLVGWAAVTGSLALPALLIAAIIFYWTPPHFWSLALLKANDYRRAGIPMLPVTHGEPVTRRSILLYALLLVAVTVLVVPAGGAGWLYLVFAIVLGGYFVALAARMWSEGSSRLAWRLFKYSNYYLALLLAVLVLDRVLGL